MTLLTLNPFQILLSFISNIWFVSLESVKKMINVTDSVGKKIENLEFVALVNHYIY